MAPTLELADVEQVQPKELLTETGDIVAAANAFIVNDPVSYSRAGDLMRGIKTGIDEIKTRLAPAKQQADRAHKAIVKLEKDAVGPRETARTTYSNKRLTWQQAEDRKRKAEEDRIRAAELERIEDERQAEALRLEAANQHAQAEAVIAAPITPPSVVLPTVVPRDEGVSVRENWTMRIVDPKLVPREWCIPDENALRARARAQRQAAVGTVPGVEFYAVKSEATRAY